MTSLPNPFNSGACPVPPAPDEAATAHSPQGQVVAAEISLSELCARGFNEEKFLFDIGFVPDDFAKYMAMLDALVENDEPPLFLQRTG